MYKVYEKERQRKRETEKKHKKQAEKEYKELTIEVLLRSLWDKWFGIPILKKRIMQNMTQSYKGLNLC